MSDSNRSQPASVSIVDEWAYLLPSPDRSAFIAACTEAKADNQRLQDILSRYFSTWKTTLMGDDLSRLQMLATYVQIRDYIKVIHLEDDTDEFRETLPLESDTIWPRHKDGQIVTEALGVELLNSMLVSHQLYPDRLEIKDKYTAVEQSDPEIAAILARDILDGADLAVTDFVLKKTTPTTTIINAELSTEHQGQGKRFSILRKAQLDLSRDLISKSYWADQILLHAPMLKELSLSFTQLDNVANNPSFIVHNTALPMPALEKLELSMGMLSVQSIMAILSNSKQSLTGISIRIFTLYTNSTWAELLSYFHNEFPNLTWFQLKFLYEKSIPTLQLTFPGLLDKDSTVRKRYANEMKLVERGPIDARRMSGVEYSGSDASHVLRIISEYAVAAPR